ncbi:MAG: hypothetical protein ACFFDK_06070 [Promethearchaeota archaeon]
MVPIRIKCPSCSKVGSINISTDMLKNSLRGLLAVNVAKDIVCSHTFIVYIDKNLTIRDYFISDFNVELPKITEEEINKIGSLPTRDVLDIDLIRLNITAPLLTYILSAIFLKQKIVIIEDQSFMHSHIFNFFKYITQTSFKTNIIIITEENFKNNKNSYKYSMVFDHLAIIRNVKNLINPKKLYIEKQLIRRFLAEEDSGYSYIILRNDIQRAYDYAKSIVNFINDFKERNETVNILKISTKLEEKYNIKVNREYLDFLIDIVKNYFGVAAPSYRDSFISALK